MAEHSQRSHIGWSRPKHRRHRSSRSIVVVSIVAVALIIAGIVVSLVPRTPSNPPGNATPPTHHTDSTTTTSVATTTTSISPTSTSTTTPPATTTTVATPTTVPTSQVLVEVLNGTGASGQAASVASGLQEAGFAINGTGDAANFRYATNVIDYAPGEYDAAVTLEHYLTGTTQLRLSSSVPSSEVDLVVGSTYNGLANT